MLGAPTPKMLQDMIDAELNTERNRYKTIQNTQFKDGVSMDDATRLA
jgi:hypothetical protein